MFPISFPTIVRRMTTPALLIAMGTPAALLVAPQAIRAQEASAIEAVPVAYSSSIDETGVSSSKSTLPDAPSTMENERVSTVGLPRRVVLDQLHIFTFPRYTEKSDLK